MDPMNVNATHSICYNETENRISMDRFMNLGTLIFFRHKIMINCLLESVDGVGSYSITIIISRCELDARISLIRHT